MMLYVVQKVSMLCPIWVVVIWACLCNLCKIYTDIYVYIHIQGVYMYRIYLYVYIHIQGVYAQSADKPTTLPVESPSSPQPCLLEVYLPFEPLCPPVVWIVSLLVGPSSCVGLS